MAPPPSCNPAEARQGRLSYLHIWRQVTRSHPTIPPDKL